MNPPAIAIDGPAASGKSTVARLVAERLGYTFINTGAMYRAIAWYAAQQGIAPEDAAAICGMLRDMPLEFGKQQAVSIVICAGRRLDTELTLPIVNETVSLIAAVPCVREYLLHRQREYNNTEPVVMEGRDIGSVVFPNTPFKYFMTASPEVRAARRAAQGLTDSITARDKNDASRSCAPLTRAADALLIDTSDMSIEQVTAAVIRDIQAKLAAQP